MKVIFGIFLLAYTSISTTLAENSELQVLQGNGQFTNNLYKVLSKEEGNVFFSPISAHAALSMAYQGAQDTTAEAFSNTLKVPQAKSAAEGYHSIMNRLNNVKNATLLIANKVFVEEGRELLPNFKTAITKDFQSDVQTLNFKNNEEAARTINDWVEKQTHEKIKDLIGKNDFNKDTKLVLINAIYFKGTWTVMFDKSLTKKMPFYLNNVDFVEVDMMNVRSRYNYRHSDELDADILEMTYTDKDISMVIIKPQGRDGIKNLEEKLQNADLTRITDGCYNEDVHLYLPKFKIEQKIDLEDALTELGLGIIFNLTKANFHGITTMDHNKNLFVTKIVQKAFIEVNEEGAEAAAVTAFEGHLGIPPDEPPPGPINFVVDHPFIMAILQSIENMPRNILFFGKATNL